MADSKHNPGDPRDGTRKRFGRAERDMVALGIATAAIIMFVGTGGVVVPQVVRSFAGVGLGPDKALTSALLLNIALIIFGWRRYRQLALEVQERRKAEEQAKLLAETDPLTGCLNRRSLADATAELITRGSERGEVVALVMIDLDNFKQINDFNGHSIGDQVLRECAARIAALLPKRALLARLGGDEFACVVPLDPKRPEAIDDLAAELIEAIASRSDVSGNGIEITASLGLTRSDFSREVGEEPADAHTLLHMADIAMYHAKRAGKNRYFWFDAPMQNELRFRREIEQGIRRGIRLGEFVPFYEQQIDLSTGQLTGFEMLARWKSPALGVISPEIFIPIAEEIGAIADLSESVIAQALEDAKTWDPRLTLSVNISPLQMRDPWFAQKLLKMLLEANFPPHRLEIEITESCLHENIGEVRTLVTSLKNQGIRISLDDFGTGYSSLAQLRSLPFDRIKIDRMFVTNLTEDSDSAAIVDAVTRLGKDLGLPVTAEGIENKEILERLMQYGDIKGQGFLYGQPQPASVTRDKLASLDLLSEPPTPSAERITPAIDPKTASQG
ncbi:putative bifunctional diguanylate cyclase/phosphodiesterase [Novosphingobium sp. JCM 18896]|uniref:putative bifunctional diguanylate cyclase/phosphodiesterase n=1 Tax=Novosphingobium sp. JCM 18896 TaxID=2989731 RepID=UPI00222350D9|nr:EAL domain-containing protein [Novosphingobium sp. JCM 18896]MCW1428110.1 EAL domain-containing protein [Novosphingobium sp. JCM 18896]